MFSIKNEKGETYTVDIPDSTLMLIVRYVLWWYLGPLALAVMFFTGSYYYGAVKNWMAFPHTSISGTGVYHKYSGSDDHYATRSCHAIQTRKGVVTWETTKTTQSASKDPDFCQRVLNSKDVNNWENYKTSRNFSFFWWAFKSFWAVLVAAVMVYVIIAALSYVLVYIFPSFVNSGTYWYGLPLLFGALISSPLTIGELLDVDDNPDYWKSPTTGYGVDSMPVVIVENKDGDLEFYHRPIPIVGWFSDHAGSKVHILF